LSLSAQPQGLITAAATNPPPAAGGSWFVLVLLTLLVVLFAVVVWVYKRRLGAAGDQTGISILNMRPVGAREQIIVARVHGRVLVLGHTPSQISLLCELEPHEVSDIPAMETGPDFSKVISKFVRKGVQP
jgi:flagellar protein FliO/FliZ